jgi:uncharacterized protein YeaO (DUF488 family)
MAGRTRLQVRLKRAYDAPAKSDGRRVLVDRLWPRGVSKDELRLDDWLKEVAPSTRLRKWFGHDPAKWGAFKDRYFRELDGQSEAVERLLARGREGIVTLVFGAKDVNHNDAVALKEYLERHAENRQAAG